MENDMEGMETETFDIDNEDCFCDSEEDLSQGGIGYVDSVLSNIFRSL